ncbi:MAG: OadG family protein [Gammaproteobacteria bacterium]|jgi:oxaloacetate decarboxylase gamma subunit|nr:OadG family protein [Gammaproteobacteria bacterium]
MTSTDTELLMEGVELMLLGVGTVFLFLIMLVGCISMMSRLVARFIPPEKSVPSAALRRPAVPVSSVDQQTLAVISEAIRLHRARRSN